MQGPPYRCRVGSRRAHRISSKDDPFLHACDMKFIKPSSHLRPPIPLSCLPQGTSLQTLASTSPKDNYSSLFIRINLSGLSGRTLEPYAMEVTPQSLRGGCQCGRNRYIITIPQGRTQDALVLFNTDSHHRTFP